MEIDRKWIIYGGIGALVLVGGYYYLSSSSTPTDTTTASGSTTYPDLTYATSPLGYTGGVGGTGGSGLTGTDALTALMNAFNDQNKGPTTEEINAQTHAADVTAGVTVFNSLVSYLNAHKGLNRIRAIIPNLGTVQVGPTPTVTKTKTVTKTTPPALLDFKKGSTVVHSLATNKAKITNLLQKGYKAV